MSALAQDTIRGQGRRLPRWLIGDRGIVAPLLFLAPFLAVFSVFLLYPIGYGLQVSFTNWDLMTSPKWVGLENYRDLLDNGLFWKSLRNTTLFVCLNVPLVVIIPLGLAMKRMQGAGNPENAPMQDLARTGKVATWPDGPWISTLFFNPDRSPNAAENSVAVLPQRDPAAPATWGQSHQFALPKQGDEDDERRAASLRFVNWMAAHAVDWAQAGQIPANNAAREQALALDNVYMEKLGVWAQQLPYVAYMKSTPKLLEVMPRIAANVEGAILGEWSVEDGLKQAEEEVNDILSS